LALQQKILAVLKSSNQPLALTALAEKAEATAQIEHVYKIVRHLAVNHRGVALHGDHARPGELTISYNHD
jgi:glucose-6-phosphate isomerase